MAKAQCASLKLRAIANVNAFRHQAHSIMMRAGYHIIAGEIENAASRVRKSHRVNAS